MLFFSVFLLSLLILVATVATIGTAIFSQIQQLVAQAPQLLDNAIYSVERSIVFLQRWNINIDLSELETQLRTQVPSTVGFLSIPLAGIAIELCGVREMQEDAH
ncbi:hypothetical protein [Chamaesiphon sp.]|uniref:hypothetical protein n=1 Tax=Chamaesiphon sp. TaxID=2814140 RepID=UPI0035938220